ncbi:MAG: hypothetical protein GJV46_05255 [Geobacter sp.]|nr:hypothetical protein [Geobacter sp.]
MQAIIQGLASVQGVVGGMISDERGNVLADSFPELFDREAARRAAEMLLDGSVGLYEACGGIKLFDIRFGEGRVIVKALPQMFMVLMCKSTVNLQLLVISLNIAVKKLEKFSTSHQLVQTARQAVLLPQVKPLAVPSVHPDYRAVSDAKGVLLTCEIMKKTANTFWDSMASSVTVNRNTALEISNFFNTGPFKKLTITNRVSGVSKNMPVSVIQHDRDRAYDGKIVVTLAVAELLKVKEGDQLRAEVVVGGGILGWEGI